MEQYIMMRRAENEFIALLDSFIINALKILLMIYIFMTFIIINAFARIYYYGGDSYINQ